jgi:hypothetical protein
MDVVKVDRDIAYVAMVVHVCCKLLFLMFHLFFQMYTTNVFIWMLHIFHTYVATVYLDLHIQWFPVVKCFRCMFSGVSFVFRRMLQVLYLDVS